jgi:hypothetical protein
MQGHTGRDRAHGRSKNTAKSCGAGPQYAGSLEHCCSSIVYTSDGAFLHEEQRHTWVNERVRLVVVIILQACLKST